MLESIAIILAVLIAPCVGAIIIFVFGELLDKINRKMLKKEIKMKSVTPIITNENTKREVIVTRMHLRLDSLKRSADSAIKRQDFISAIKLYDGVRKRAPDFAERELINTIHYFIHSLKWMELNNVERIRNCDLINQIYPNALCYYKKASILYEQHRFDEAEKVYLEAYSMKDCTSNMKDNIQYMLECIRNEIVTMKRVEHISNVESENGFRYVKTGIDYENFVVGIIKRVGLEYETTPDSGDQGVDIIVESPFGRVAIQCKFYSIPVSNAAVQEVVAGKAFYNCVRACVVSNADYTAAARALAEANNVKLLHHADIINYLYSQ